MREPTGAVRTRTGRNPLAGIARKDMIKPEKIPSKRTIPDLEKETVINYNEAEPMATIFTYNRAFIKHLKTKFKLTPMKDNGFGGLFFELDKSRLRFPQPKRQLSDTAKKAGAERLATARKKKGGTAPR